MAYHLYIGNKSISSWSLRTWLLFKQFGIPFEETVLSLNTPTQLHKVLDQLGPHIRTVPVLQDDDYVLGDSLAIAEYLAESFPGLWPEDKIARAEARFITAELQSSYNNLRTMCPFRCTEKNLPWSRTTALESEIQQMDRHLAYVLTNFSGQGDFLFGEYCIADAYFTAAASCSQIYHLPFSTQVATYFARLVEQHAFQEWVEQAHAEHVPSGI